MALESKEIWGEAGELDAELLAMTADQLKTRKAVLESKIRGLKSDVNKVDNQIKEQELDIKDNTEKIKLNKQLPYLVGNVVEVRRLDCSARTLQLTAMC
jgi:26S proteasome regulatory subunit T5